MKQLLRGLWPVLLTTLIVPIIGIVVAQFVLLDLNRDLRGIEMPNVTVVCGEWLPRMADAEERADLRSFCTFASSVRLLRNTALIAAAINVSLPLLYWVAAAVAGRNRKRLAAIFPLTLRGSLLVLVLSTLIQGAVFVGSIYIAETYFLGVIHLRLLGVIGIGVLVLCGALINIVRRFNVKPGPSRVHGVRLLAKDAPRLHQLIRETAAQVGTESPDHVIVGHDSSFFVTSQETALLNGPTLRGRTLFLSAPLCRLLTQRELLTIIGHELGHFKGEDLVYTERFLPVYMGVERALVAVQNTKMRGGFLLKRPLNTVLRYMGIVFDVNVARIRREREFAADAVGAAVGSPLAVTTALLKSTLYGELWNVMRNRNVDRLREGKRVHSLSAELFDVAHNDVRFADFETMKRDLLAKTVPHPIDSHPPIAARMSALGVASEAITASLLGPPTQPASILIDGFADLEAELTEREFKWLRSRGIVRDMPSPEPAWQMALYALTARILGAHNLDSADPLPGESLRAVIEAAGIRAASNEADASSPASTTDDTKVDAHALIIEGFDMVTLRSVMRHAAVLPTSAALVETLRAADDEIRTAVVAYLTALGAALAAESTTTAIVAALRTPAGERMDLPAELDVTVAMSASESVPESSRA